MSLNVLFDNAAEVADMRVIPIATNPTPGTITPAALPNVEIQVPILANSANVGALMDIPGNTVTATPSRFNTCREVDPDCVTMAAWLVRTPATGDIRLTAALMILVQVFME